jgi:oligoribonuclease NrnB/cAMP/cGMP phosphodiesterase (DHH superfamily)
MIPREALEGVRKIIVHANGPTSPCADGRASAIILRHAFRHVRGLEIVEMAYGSKEHKELKATPGLLFCDFTPPKERLNEFVEAGAIVLDHHDLELVKPFGARGVFGHNELVESGASLALRECYKPMINGQSTPFLLKLARLASVRDTWRKDDLQWKAACEWSAALCFYSLEELLLNDADVLQYMLNFVGGRLVEQHMDEAQELAKTALYVGEIYNRRTRETPHVYIIPSLKTSDVAELLFSADRSPAILAGFGFIHEAVGDSGAVLVRLVVSLRSRNFDVQELAARHGGGGHKSAAGFQIYYERMDDRYVDNPYAAIVEAIKTG